jgi:hypothetical protein
MKGSISNLGGYSTARVFSDLGVTQIGSAPKGTTVEVLRTEGAWAAVNKFLFKARTTVPAVFYVAAETVVYQIEPPPPTPVSGTVIGKHAALPALPLHQLVGLHMLEAGKPQLQEYMDANCRSFTCLNNVLAAREARDVGAAVIFRRFIDHGVVPDPEDFARHLGVDSGDRLMLMGINEADNISTSAIRKRFEWDEKFARAIWRLYPKCFPLIGSFSMGTPQLENADVAREWRETYGAFLNANWERVGLNYHSYSGRTFQNWTPSNAPVIAPTWLESRFLEFGYNPLLGALDKRVILTGDESGRDVMGTGGFLACGDGPTQFWMYLSHAQGVFGPHPQAYVRNLFQADRNNQRWAGYNVWPYLGELRMLWAGKQNRTEVFMPLVGNGDSDALPNRLQLVLSEFKEVSPLPEGWTPPAKDHGA